MAYEIMSNINSTIMMSSKDISELTGKQHAHVMRDIRAMLDQLEQNPKLDFVCKTTTYTAETGQSYPMYELDKNATICLVAGYDAVVRMAIINRWAELEKANQREMTELEIIKVIVTKAIEQERIAAEHEAKLLQHEARLEKTEAQIKDIVDTEQWFTARAAGILYNYRHLSSSNVQKLGKALSNKSREMGIEIIKRPHKDFGEVGTYHIDVIRAVFDEDNFQF